MKNKRKLAFLYIGSFLITLLPISVYFAAFYSRYVQNVTDALKLSAGGIIVVVTFVLLILGKLKVPRRIVTCAIIFALAYLLEAVLVDLKIIMAIVLASESLDLIFFQWAIKKTKEQILVDKTADTTTAQVEQVIKKYVGRL